LPAASVACRIAAVTDYVKFFRDAAPYINMHRGGTFVLAIPGEGVRHDNFSHIIQDVALLNSLGVNIVLVYGADAQIDERLQRAQVPAQFSNGTRVIDANAMACARDVIGSLRIGIESLLSMGLAHSPMHGAQIRVVSGNFVTAKPLGVRNGVDFHHTGVVRRIDGEGIRRQLDEGAIVLLAPIGYSPTGEAFTLGFDDVATQTAIAIGAEKLMLLGAGPGILDANGALEKTLSLAELPAWLERTATDIPTNTALQASFRACRGGVARCHLISYADNGALFGELFTRNGAGTLVLQDSAEVIRQATIDDVGGILDLIAPLEEQGVLVKRSRELLEMEISRFYVAVDSEDITVSCAALYPFADSESAELACVATRPEFHNRGLASRLLRFLEQQARDEFGLRVLFVLTTQAAHWFQEQGFRPSTLDALPAEKANLYNYQRKSKIFQKEL
jgi:amino-acid N-acetyltransferase